GAAKGWTCAGRHAFDFNRRLGSVLASGPEGQVLIVKGSPDAVLALCTSRRGGVPSPMMGPAERTQAMGQVQSFAEQGLRTVAVASRPWVGATHDIAVPDEADLVFEGFCAFADPPKA